MKLKVVASGSKGNCYILESGEQILLLECGIRFKDIQQALRFDFSRVVGCLVTHSHKDHCKAVPDVMKAGIDVYCSPGTIEALEISGHRLNEIQSQVQFEVDRFTVLPFSTQHDATDSLGFLVHDPATKEKLLFLTDSFYSRYRFTGLNYIAIECNYCLETLNANIEAGLIPNELKNRIIQSHFSLEQVKEFLKVNTTTDTRKIILLHLSDNNSDAERMVREIKEQTGIDTVIADTGAEIELELYPF
jgi:phosphoribosyl 1,2-cyclic phosphodiesterase